MSLKIKKDRSNIDDNIVNVNVNDFIGNWNVQPDDELTKLMAEQIQDSINIEIMKTLIDSYNHPTYIPELTVKLNESEQIVF